LIAPRALLRSVAVVRFRIWLAAALAVGAIITGLLRAQVTEEQQNRGDKSDTSESRARILSKTKENSEPRCKTSNRQVSEEREKNPTKQKRQRHRPRRGRRPSPPLHPNQAAAHTDTRPKAAKKKSHEKETAKKAKKTGKSESARKEEETPKPERRLRTHRKQSAPRY